MREEINDDGAIRARHSQRIEEMRRSKEKQLQFRANFKRYAPPAAAVLIVLILILARVTVFHRAATESKKGAESGEYVEAGSAGNAGYAGSKGAGSAGHVDVGSTESAGNMEDGSAGNAGYAGSKSAGGGNAGGGSPDTGGTGGNGTDVGGAGAGNSEIDGIGTDSIFFQNIGDKIADGLASALDSVPGSGSGKQEGEKQQKVYSAKTAGDTDVIGEEEIYSQYGILIDLAQEKILAQKGAFSVINPASMTKILTVLVAAEHVEDLDDTFTITLEITDYGYTHDCSSAGFEKEETVSVRDLFYGTVLPSGADAAVGLAVYVAGSQEAFVEMMNDKLGELGLSKSAHFTNCVGIYDEGHYCTVYDMAMILEAALDNELCREVLSAKRYTTSETEQHPEGISLSNWFLRRIEDRDCGGEVLSGKTGYVVQSGNCAASYGVSKNGGGFVCVTAGANSPWRCIADHAALYKRYLYAGV